MKSISEEQFKEILGLYSKKGYQIIEHPKTQKELPPFLRSLNYYPDFIIKSDNNNFIIEFKSPKDTKAKGQSEMIVEEVESHESWEFIMVMSETEPEIDEPEHKEPQRDSELVRKVYHKFKLVIENEQSGPYPEFVLLYGFGLVELMIRTLLDKEQIESVVKVLLNEAVDQGIIEDSESLVLNDLNSIRDEVSHGNFDIDLNKSGLDFLIAIINKLYTVHFSE